MTIALLLYLLSTHFSLLGNTYTIPEGMLLSNGLSTIFVAKFALFIATLLLWTILSGRVLKELFNCPIIAGEIIGGILIGPSFLHILGWKVFKEPLQVFDAASNTMYALASSDLFLFLLYLSHPR